jgi:predicted small lipoprotein YifL
MKNRRYFILILFSFLLSACGQQGPLFMPVEVEQEPIENSTMEHTPIEIDSIEVGPIESSSQEAEIE